MMPIVKPQPLKVRLRKAVAMAKRLDEYIAAGSPAGVPPPRRSGILQGTHAALDRYAELQQANAAGADSAMSISARIGAAETLIAELKGDPPAPLTAALAARYRDIIGHAMEGFVAASSGAAEADADD